MSMLERQKALRARSEHELRLKAMETVAARYPDAATKPAMKRGGPFWRLFFVPLYRRIPWHVKARAMRLLRMTTPGWNNERHWQEPWRPPKP